MTTNASGIYIGEGLAGEGNEIAHIDLLLGPKTGPMGIIFGNTLTRQTRGHSNLLAGITPNRCIKPDTVTFAKVTIAGAKQAVQMFGPAQASVAWAVGDALVANEFEPLGDPNELCVVVGVFIHWDAAEDRKIFDYNYEATRLAIRRAVNGGPTADEVKAWIAAGETDPEMAHPFKGDWELPEALKALRAKFPAEAAAA